MKAMPLDRRHNLNLNLIKRIAHKLKKNISDRIFEFLGKLHYSVWFGTYCVLRLQVEIVVR